jgi:hypothetical protein
MGGDLWLADGCKGSLKVLIPALVLNAQAHASAPGIGTRPLSRILQIAI